MRLIGKNVEIILHLRHALQAGENRAKLVSLLVRKGKLFYPNVNDNFRDWDWDLIPGFVNLWDYLELLFYLKEYDYQDWVAERHN